ncbi:MAG: putative motility protein [Synergistetes bacterium]|nr:putative motility protein [Synergistota bacterium]
MVEGIANAVMQSKQVEFLLNVQTRLMKKQMDLQKEMMNELLQSLGVGNNLNVVG